MAPQRADAFCRLLLLRLCGGSGSRLPCVLQEFILNQDWNDPKSQLQQCCLTLRTEGKEPDIPLYK